MRLRIIIGVLACLPALSSNAEDVVPNPVEVVISVADQRMALLREGGVVAKYPISTSKFGLGDSFGSYKTPLGLLKVCDKVGGDCVSGTVIKHREPTNEILPVNAPGRDPIVTRVLWLDGQENQNRNARARGIYIHGTPEEKRIGDPVSWGCIRMRSRDVIELFSQIPVGTPVRIVATKLPKLRNYVPAPSAMIASKTPDTKVVQLPGRPITDSKPERETFSKEATATYNNPAAVLALSGSILSTGLSDIEKTGIQKR